MRSEPPLWDDPYGDPSRPRRRWGKQDGLYGGGETREMAAAKKECASLLFALAGLQLLCGFAALAVLPDEMFGGAAGKNATSWLVMGLGLAFAGLGYWALSQPLPASIVGLTIYVIFTIIQLQAIIQLGMGMGLYIRIAIIAALVRAVSSAAKASASRPN
jgi:hypothetical protein